MSSSAFGHKPTFTYRCKVTTPWTEGPEVKWQAYGPSYFKFHAAESTRATHVRLYLQMDWPRAYDSCEVKVKLGVVNKNGNIVLPNEHTWKYDDRTQNRWASHKAVERAKLAPHTDADGFVTFGAAIHSVKYSPDHDTLLVAMWDKLANGGKMASSLQAQLDQASLTVQSLQAANDELKRKTETLARLEQDNAEWKAKHESAMTEMKLLKTMVGHKRKRDEYSDKDEQMSGIVDLSKEEDERKNERGASSDVAQAPPLKQQKTDTLTRFEMLTKDATLSSLSVTDLRKLQLAVSAFGMDVTKATTEALTCRVCLAEEATMLIQPCGHRCMCEGCSKRIVATTSICPICRGAIVSSQKIYI